MKLQNSWVFVLIIAILLIISGILLLVGKNTIKTIVIEVDGELTTLTTRALTVSEAIKNAGIQLSTQDNITPNMNHIIMNGDQILIHRAKFINLLVDGEARTFLTTEKQISKILDQANISYDGKGRLFINAEEGDVTSFLPQSSIPITIQIQHAVPIIVSDGKSEKLYKTASSTIINALWNTGIIVESSDLLSHPPYTPIQSNLKVSIIRARPIKIKTQSGNMTVKSTASNVGEALAQAGLSLQGLDYSVPNPEAPIPKNNEIQLVRLRDELIIEHIPIQFETEYQPSDDLEIDTRSTIQPGEYGLTARRVRVRYQDGNEISRIIEEEWVAKEPKSRIVGYGTKLVKKITETPDGPIEYWRALRMYAVSYRPKETDNTTASGLPLKKGVAAIDRRYIPFYTRMYIPGYGEAVAADVGGGVIGRMIDLGYSNEDYISWHEWVTVYFLWPPPDNIVWFIP